MNCVQIDYLKDGERMENTELLYTSLTFNSFLAFMLILISVSCLTEENKTPLLKIYTHMVMSCVAGLLFEAISCAFALFGKFDVDITRIVLNDLAIICGYYLSFHYAQYVSNMVGLENKKRQLLMRILRIAGVVSACVLVAGSFFELFFTVRNGSFEPCKFFVFIFVFDIAACLTGILLIIKYRKKLNRKDIIALMSLPVLIFISATMQYTGFGIMFGLFLMSGVSLFIIYLMIQADRNRQKAEQEKQLMDMNIAMMLSQIQPHFLYNALSSIRRMIRKDPEVAATAVENFSMYLRQNLESMNRVEPIPFTQELKHLREYLYLEKLRFGNRLNVEYDLGYEDFVLPVLSLQPIVENAVKHGILKKEEGGCVRISTHREGNMVILTVSDDGVGFHTDSVHNNDRMHIGFNNVKSRIEMQCRGTVSVESTIGAGTTVKMTIPLV